MAAKKKVGKKKRKYTRRAVAPINAADALATPVVIQEAMQVIKHQLQLVFLEGERCGIDTLARRLQSELDVKVKRAIGG